MQHLCAECNVCTFMPEQKFKRLFEQSVPLDAKDPLVLVLDHVSSLEQQADSLQLLRDVLLTATPFTYSNVIRCEYDVTEIGGDNLIEALNACSVWTHQLLEDRAVVLTTEEGLEQMQIGEKKRVGDMFRNGRVGVVLVIPPISSFIINPGLVKVYLPKIQRVLKEVNLVPATT